MNLVDIFFGIITRQTIDAAPSPARPPNTYDLAFYLILQPEFACRRCGPRTDSGFSGRACPMTSRSPPRTHSDGAYSPGRWTPVCRQPGRPLTSCYGGDPILRRDLQARSVGYVLAVAKSHRVAVTTSPVRRLGPSGCPAQHLEDDPVGTPGGTTLPKQTTVRGGRRGPTATAQARSATRVAATTTGRRAEVVRAPGGSDIRTRSRPWWRSCCRRPAADGEAQAGRGWRLQVCLTA